MNKCRGKLLIVDDDEAIRKSFLRQLKRLDYLVHTEGRGKTALAALERESFDLAIVDYRMPEMNGLTLLREIQTRRPAMPVIMATSEGSLELAMDAMKSGAVNFITKPLNLEKLDADIQQIMKVVRLQQEVSRVSGILETVKVLSFQMEGSALTIKNTADGMAGSYAATGRKISAAAERIKRALAAMTETIRANEVAAKERQDA